MYKETIWMHYPSANTLSHRPNHNPQAVSLQKISLLTHPSRGFDPWMFDFERWVNLQRIGDMSMVDLDQCMNWKGEERCHLQKEKKLDIFNFAKFSNCSIYCREVDRISSNLFAFDNLNLKGRIC